MRAIEALEKLPLTPEIKEQVRQVLLAAEQGVSICVLCRARFPMKPGEEDEVFCDRCREGD